MKLQLLEFTNKSVIKTYKLSA